MATINSVGSGLKGTSGTGNFAGTNTPVLTTPKISTVNDSNNKTVFQMLPSTNAVNYIAVANSATGVAPYFFAVGTDTNVGFQFSPKGTGGYLFASTATTNQYNLQINGGDNYLSMPTNGNNNVYTFPDNSTAGNVCCDTSGNHSITTAPPASSAPSLAIGTAYQNTLGYDINVTVYLAVTAATSASILLGVDNNNAPSQQTIVSGLTLASLQVIPIQIYIPAQYYALLSTSGTITRSISGQIQIPV